MKKYSILNTFTLNCLISFLYEQIIFITNEREDVEMNSGLAFMNGNFK
jgi:hypothetical protein